MKRSVMPRVWAIGAAMLLTFFLTGSHTPHILASGARRVGLAGVGHWVVCDMVSKLRDPEVARERAQFAASWIMSSIDVTETQKERVKEAVDALVGDLAGFTAKHRENRRAFVAELARPAIDRLAIEDIRRSEIELLDATSKRLADGFADIAETLTPDQRREFLASPTSPRH